MKTTIVSLALSALLLAGSCVQAQVGHKSAEAALQDVSGFSNPGSLTMQKYIPAGLPTGAPLVVVLHGCLQNGPEYHEASGWREMADRHQFALLVPSQNNSNHIAACFNWYRPEHIGRDRGESASIISAAKKVIADHGLDDQRVFVTGLSAGGCMTSALLAVYPDFFRGGAIHAGVEYGCVHNPMVARECMQSPSQGSGEVIRKANPEYKGPWPKVLVFHGTDDRLVAFAHVDSHVNQWTNVHGTDNVADVTGSLGKMTVRHYQNSQGQNVVETYAINGMRHAVAIAPGTAEEQCGSAKSEYYADFGVCSSHIAAKSWGITRKTPASE